MNPITWLDEGVARAIMGIHAVLGSLFGPNSGWAWGLSIVVLVMFIRLLLVPLFIKQVNAQRKMAQHAPQLQELRKKYKNDKQRLQEETMKFYKENGVNPLAGCLPMIPQMIIFFSLFSVLRAIANWLPGHKPPYGMTDAVVSSARDTTIFGVHLADKLLFAQHSVPVHVAVVIVLTVCISAATTFMTVRQTAKRGLMQTSVDPDNPMAQSQKIMQYIVPFFSLTGLYWQYGLVLYWVSTNIWTLGQQYLMFRNWAPIGTADVTTGGTASGTGVAKSGSATKPGGPAKPGGAGRTGGAAKPGGAKTPATGASTGKSAARPRTGSGVDSRGGAAVNGSVNGGAKRGGLLGLGKAKQEPEPVDDTPAVKVVRQQQTRQSRSKRSGNK